MIRPTLLLSLSLVHASFGCLAAPAADPAAESLIAAWVQYVADGVEVRAVIQVFIYIPFL